MRWLESLKILGKRLTRRPSGWDSASTAAFWGLITDQGTKILHASQHVQHFF